MSTIPWTCCSGSSPEHPWTNPSSYHSSQRHWICPIWYFNTMKYFAIRSELSALISHTTAFIVANIYTAVGRKVYKLSLERKYDYSTSFFIILYYSTLFCIKSMYQYVNIKYQSLLCRAHILSSRRISHLITSISVPYCFLKPNWCAKIRFF